jgi:hypothetical protein
MRWVHLHFPVETSTSPPQKILETSKEWKYLEFMSALASLLNDTALADRVFNERQIASLLGGSDARRWALVNRALKDGSLLRLKRGTYVLTARHKTAPFHPFAAAQALLPGSYVSFETALAHHGWIPEAVYTTANVTPGRKTLRYEATLMGRFVFHPLALNGFRFLEAIERRRFGSMTAFIASPLRALMDLVALRKEPWTGLDWLTAGLRIDEASLRGLRRQDFAVLRPVYKHKAANDFLAELEKAVCFRHPPAKASG